MVKQLLRVVLCLFLLLQIPVGASGQGIGALMPIKKVPFYMAAHEALEKELAGKGDILLQKPAPDALSWANATRKLVTLDSKVIVAYGTATTLAVLKENNKIPVVYCGAFDPEAAGISGRNVTGISSTVAIAGLIKNMKRIANFSKLGVIFSSEEADSVKEADAAAALAGQLGFEVVKHDVKDEGDAIVLPKAEAVLLTTASHAMNENNLQAIVEQARASKTLTAALLSGTAEEGVIISLSANPVHQGQEAAKMVASILGGAAPSSIPANNSPKVEMTINVKEAKELGFNIPFELLGTAKVIK